MVIFYHLSYSFEKRTPIVLDKNSKHIKQRKIITIILSLPAIFLWGILFQLNSPGSLNPLFNSILFSFITMLFNIFIEWLLFKTVYTSKKNLLFDIGIYIIHSVIAFPILWSTGSLFIEKIKKFNPNITSITVIGILFSYFVFYIIINEILFYFHSKNTKVKISNTIPLNKKEIYGSYVLELPKGYKEKYFSIYNKENGIHVCFKNDNIKIKGNFDKNKIYADLSGELPRIELYKTKFNEYSGTYTKRINNKECIFHVKAFKETN